MTEYQYVGSELTLFAEATRWKQYLRSQMEPYLGDDVLEVGAGLGGTTKLLSTGRERRWLGLEPDRALAEQLERASREGILPACFEVFGGTLGELPAGLLFDTLLYVDVLEHIQDDRGEMVRAASRLIPVDIWSSSRSPVAVFAVRRVDRHYRRYNRTSLAPDPPLEPVRLAYLDAGGCWRLKPAALRRSMPTGADRLWDRDECRSRLLDPLASVGGHAWRKR
jgi:hypothetical protein